MIQRFSVTQPSRLKLKNNLQKLSWTLRKPSKKGKTKLMLITFLMFSSTISFVFASFLRSPYTELQHTKSEPTVIGKFKASIKIYKVTDLYTWQVSIKYNQSELKVLEIIPGDFLGDDQVFTNSTDSFPNVLMIMGSLKGPTSGKSGNGTLAVIVFGYYKVNYAKPVLMNDGPCKTIFLDSNGCKIPFELSNFNGDYAHLALCLDDGSG